MFKTFYLRNFKVWGEQLWEGGVELAPVNLFLGPNSAGKTSLLQLPLLLKQTFESPDRHLDLNLGGQSTDILDFGTYEDLVHEHEPRRELGLGLEFEGAVRRGGRPASPTGPPTPSRAAYRWCSGSSSARGNRPTPSSASRRAATSSPLRTTSRG